MIKQDGFGYNEASKELNWAAAYAKRELKNHKEQSPIDHPDESVTTAKLAKDSITTEKIANATVTKAKLGEDVNEIFSDIREGISAETSSRQQADDNLQNNINTEKSERETADTSLRNEINTEASSRQSGDNALHQAINAEKTERKATDAELDDRLSEVEEQAHTHDNKAILDGISEEDIKKWDKEDNISRYMNNMFFGIVNQLHDIYTAIGINHYDGGLFGMEYGGRILDGGSFAAAEIRITVDCGDFGNRSVPANTGNIEFATDEEFQAMLDEVFNNNNNN